jgi:hypothetical protein
MAKTERFREILRGPLDADHLRQKAAEGWKLVGIECQWERESEEPTAPESVRAQNQISGSMAEVPFGFQVASDCVHLEQNPEEIQVLKALMELIVEDVSVPRMAQELNRRGFRTRDGSTWTAVAVFKTFPRLVEVAARIFPTEDWDTRRKQISRVAWNS